MSYQPFNNQVQQNYFSSPSTSLQAPGGSIDTNTYPQELIPFPAVEDSWFANGLPSMVTPDQKILEGDLIDVFPANYFAKKSGNFSFGTTPGNTGSYYLKDGVVYQRYDVKNANPGDFLVTWMAEKNNDLFVGCKVNSKGYWRLLQDFGGIDAGSKSSQTVSVTSGQSDSQTQSTSIAVGFSAGVKGTISPIEVNAQLSTTLTQTFSTTVTFTESITTSTTVDFSAQQKDQRIGVYQYYRSYGLIQSDESKKRIKERSDANPNAELLGAPTTSFYPTNHFQKVFVLDPN